MSTSIKKILIFSTTYFPYIGGAEVAVKEITDRIQNVQFEMVTLRFDADLPKQERIGNINVHRIGFTRKGAEMKDLVRYPLMLNKYLFPFIAPRHADTLKNTPPSPSLVRGGVSGYDMIWSVMASYAGFGGMFYKQRHPDTPLLLTLQEGDPLDFYQKRVRLVSGWYKNIFTSADRIQVISNYLAVYARQMGFSGQVDVVPNGVSLSDYDRKYSVQELDDLKAELGKKPNDIFIVTTGRLVLKNAVDDVIKSLQYLPENVKFLIVGEGPDKDKLWSLAQELDLEKRVIFLGQKEHSLIPLYLKIADIFIRPSLSEGLGNSFLEAMAASLPVIATDTGGIPDFLFDPYKNPDKEPTGLFCNAGDPQDIAKKVKIYLENKDLKERIIRNAREMVRVKYDWDLIAGKMEEVFGGLIVDNAKCKNQKRL
jgi:glycosyltransferase involved in cell wall biosynthesis